MPVKRILIVNPNTSAPTALKMQKECELIASPDFKIRAVAIPETDQFKAEKVFSYIDLAYAVIETVKIAWSYRDKVDGVLLAGFSDVGLDPLREILDIPVVGIGEASCLMASLLGHRFSILTGTDKWTPPKQDTLARHGLTGRISSLRSYSEWSDTSGPEEILDGLEKVSRLCIDTDGAEAIVIGAGPLVGFGKLLQNRLGIPVLDPTLCGYLQLESCIKLDISHSKKRKWRNPPALISDSEGIYNYCREWMNSD